MFIYIYRGKIKINYSPLPPFLICTHLNKSGVILYKTEQICTYLFKFAHLCTNLHIFAQICVNWAHNCTNLRKIETLFAHFCIMFAHIVSFQYTAYKYFNEKYLNKIVSLTVSFPVVQKCKSFADRVVSFHLQLTVL